MFIEMGGETLKIFDKKGGKAWHFEDHAMCGPMPIDKKTKQGIHVAGDSEFWVVVTKWYQQGKKISKANNVCLLDYRE